METQTQGEAQILNETRILTQIPASILLPAADMVQTQDRAHANWGGFLLSDILWAIGVWSVILTLSPVVMFYVLMVN